MGHDADRLRRARLCGVSPEIKASTSSGLTATHSEFEKSPSGGFSLAASVGCALQFQRCSMSLQHFSDLARRQGNGRYRLSTRHCKAFDEPSLSYCAMSRFSADRRKRTVVYSGILKVGISSSLIQFRQRSIPITGRSAIAFKETWGRLMARRMEWVSRTVSRTPSGLRVALAGLSPETSVHIDPELELPIASVAGLRALTVLPCALEVTMPAGLMRDDDVVLVKAYIDAH